MLQFLHTRHTGEDELLFPLLRERAALDPELMDRMDAQHAQVNDADAAVGAELSAWTASADAASDERAHAELSSIRNWVARTCGPFGAILGHVKTPWVACS
jgi:Hemerythrin HHE cation binding domain